MNPMNDRVDPIELLEATHTFPCDYPITVIIRNEPAIVADVRAAVEEGLPEPLPDSSWEAVPSRGGKYLSLRFRIPCADAPAVLTLYARVKGRTGVMQVL